MLGQGSLDWKYSVRFAYAVERYYMSYRRKLARDAPNVGI